MGSLEAALSANSTGIDAMQKAQTISSGNLANVRTNAYKALDISFKDLMYQETRAAGVDAGDGGTVPSSIETCSGVAVASTRRDFSQGSTKQTGRDTDLMIDGVAFYEVQMADGTTAYTKDGSLDINKNGEWVTSGGLKLQSGFTTLSSPEKVLNINVSENGTVTVVYPDSTQAFKVTLAQFPNPQGLKAIGSNLYLKTDASGDAVTGEADGALNATIRQGYVELSNVNVVQEFSNMMINQRMLEANTKAAQTSDAMLQTAANMKRG